MSVVRVFQLARSVFGERVLTPCLTPRPTRVLDRCFDPYAETLQRNGVFLPNGIMPIYRDSSTGNNRETKMGDGAPLSVIIPNGLKRSCCPRRVKMSPFIMQRDCWGICLGKLRKPFLNSRKSHPRRAWDTAYHESEACAVPLLRQRHVFCGCGADEASLRVELLTFLSRRSSIQNLGYILWMLPRRKSIFISIGIRLHP